MASDPLLDSDGAPFVDGAEYTDRFGDTWRAAFDATEFRHIAWVDGRTYESEAASRSPLSPPLIAHFQDAASVVAGYGPMSPLGGDDDDQ